MIKTKVKLNKANGVKYVYLPKECGFEDGAEVEIRYSGIGIYDDKELDIYYKENKELFLKIKELRKKTHNEHYGKLLIKLNKIGEITKLGKFIWDETCGFEDSNYEFGIYMDIDPTGFKNIHGLDLDRDFCKQIKEMKLNDNDVKEQVSDFAINFMAKQLCENTIEKHEKDLEEGFKKLGFENMNSPGGIHYDVGFSNGIIRVNREDELGRWYLTSLSKETDGVDKKEILLR